LPAGGPLFVSCPLFLGPIAPTSLHDTFCYLKSSPAILLPPSDLAQYPRPYLSAPSLGTMSVWTYVWRLGRQWRLLATGATRPLGGCGHWTWTQSHLWASLRKSVATRLGPMRRQRYAFVTCVHVVPAVLSIALTLTSRRPPCVPSTLSPSGSLPSTSCSCTWPSRNTQTPLVAFFSCHVCACVCAPVCVCACVCRGHMLVAVVATHLRARGHVLPSRFPWGRLPTAGQRKPRQPPQREPSRWRRWSWAGVSGEATAA
jgi:hypothetical protein